MHVVVAGPSHSGKSTFTAALIEHIRERQREKPFNISFEWMTLDITDNSLQYLLDETGDTDRKLDVEWTNENAQERADEFAEKSSQLVIADAPGKLTEQLDIVIGPADEMVLLISDEKSEKGPEWRERASDHDIGVRCHITTFLDSENTEVTLSEEEGELKGSITSVSRDDFDAEGTHAFDDGSRRVIRIVATRLMKQASK